MKISKNDKRAEALKRFRRIQPESLLYTYKSAKAGNFIFFHPNVHRHFQGAKAACKEKCAAPNCPNTSKYRMPRTLKSYCSAPCYAALKKSVKNYDGL